MTTDTTAGELASIEAVARMLCHEPTARRIADQIDAPSFDESSEPVQLYWLALAAALQPAAADLGWQDIATAPKDGTSVLVVEAAKPNHPYLWERRYQAVHQANFEDGVWLSCGLSHLENEYFHLTYWMPLPAAPSVEGGQSNDD